MKKVWIEQEDGSHIKKDFLNKLKNIKVDIIVQDSQGFYYHIGDKDEYIRQQRLKKLEKILK